MKIRHTTMRNPYMKMAYRIAKDLYLINRWNDKTVPVCVIVKGKNILSYGIGGNGMHQMAGFCARVNKPGSPYSACEWCRPEMHAEIQALQLLTRDPKGATMYMYGMYKMCPDCAKAVEAAGIVELVLLERAHILFDRHRRGTVVGRPEQFGIKSDNRHKHDSDKARQGKEPGGAGGA